MGCINICGINRKFNPLKNFLAQDKISILAISETHTVKSIVVSKFHCYQRNSEINPTRSGGVALLVAQNLASTPHTLPNHLNHLEAVAVNLHLQIMSILIISYYNRPQDRVSADLLRYAAQHNFAIVLGDFNARHTDCGDTRTNPNGRSLNSLITTLPLCRLHNTDPTFLSHTGCSITDHILSTENFVPFLYPHCSIGTTVTSDHVPLKTHFLLDDLQRQNPEHQVPPNRSSSRGPSGFHPFPPFSALYTAEIFLLQMPPGRRPDSSPTTPPCGQARETPRSPPGSYRAI
jgi:endonuclease/exonuclease/phosphatase family metal-dependent hydrolase